MRARSTLILTRITFLAERMVCQSRTVSKSGRDAGTFVEGARIFVSDNAKPFPH
jgi:hypothetical protein